MLVKYNRPVTAHRFNKAADAFLNRNLADFFGSDSLMSQPAVNVRELSDRFLVEVAAPGLQKEDFNIDLDQYTLRISVTKEKETNETEGKYTRREFGFDSFERSFRLPKTLDKEQIGASYENGILVISLPKRKEEIDNGPRRIEIG